MDARTRGWIAGLQLAALSMRGRDDVAGFINALPEMTDTSSTTWSRKYCRISPDASGASCSRRSILEVNSSLCDAVTDQADGGAMLEALERGNLFVVPLDDKRQWYRYHQLFADVLQ